MNELIPYISPKLEMIQINLESSMLQGVSNQSFNEDEDDIFNS